MNSKIDTKRWLALGPGTITLALALAACSSGGDKAQQKGAGAAGARTPTVGFVTLQPVTVPVTTELSGRTTAYESSDVRPQVNGLIRRRFFVEGSLVKKGQPLYEIDPRLYRAAANQAVANLQSAAANAESTKILVDRYKPLVDMQAIAKQDYTNAVASARQAAASVAQNRAALDTAKVNLNFTTVPSPITGRIGRSLYTVGALVSASQTEPLAQIQRLDPMFVDIQQAATDITALRQSLGKDGIVATRADVKLKLEDGTTYGYTGSIEFSEVLVDTSTGTVTLRAKFPNPQGLLLPGMFVRTSFAQALNTHAYLVPQAAISRDAQGNATLYVVGDGNKAVSKKVTAERTQGAYWVVTSGLAQGDRIIVQGVSKLKANQAVNPVPADTPQKIAPPQQGSKTSGGATAGQKAG